MIIVRTMAILLGCKHGEGKGNYKYIYSGIWLINNAFKLFDRIVVRVYFSNMYSSIFANLYNIGRIIRNVLHINISTANTVAS